MLEIENLNLSVRSYNCLKNAGIHSVEDLLKYPECDLLKVKSLGRKSFNEIISQLAKYKLSPEQFETSSSECSMDEIKIKLEQAIQRDIQTAKLKAEQGNPRAQFNLGKYYYDGKEIEKNLEKAFYWFNKSAIQGKREAQYYLAQCYRDGDGTTIDYLKAFYWFEKAAEQGHLYAQNNMGKCYYKGKGVDKNINMAKVWFEKAAKRGYFQAKCNLKMCERENSFHGNVKE